MDPRLERALAERSASQLRLITREQLPELGLTVETIRWLVNRGRLVPLGRAHLSHRRRSDI